jgi:hypothetical protein
VTNANSMSIFKSWSGYAAAIREAKDKKDFYGDAQQYTFNFGAWFLIMPRVRCQLIKIKQSRRNIRKWNTTKFFRTSPTVLLGMAEGWNSKKSDERAHSKRDRGGAGAIAPRKEVSKEGVIARADYYMAESPAGGRQAHGRMRVKQTRQTHSDVDHDGQPAGLGRFRYYSPHLQPAIAFRSQPWRDSRGFSVLY